MSKKFTSEKSGNLSGTLPNFKMKTLALLTRSVIFATLLPPEVYAELPDPCRGGCGPDANLSFVQAGEASQKTSSNTMTVTQSSDKAVLNWNSFNVSADAAVNFAQKNANSVALNRIFSGVPSKILGNVSANGQIYLINPSGILFGQSSKVNVGGLVASTLNVDTDTFMNSGIATALNNQNPTGTVAKDNYAAFRNKEEEWGEHDASQKIEVAAGASIKTHGGGNVIMVGKTVENNGNITADDGQVLLVAAEDRVYLQPSDDLALRGFLVEVDTGGTVSNTGEVKAERGNVTLAGHAVNQHGVVKATTSIDRNGSIYLQARDGGNVKAGTAGKKNTLTATRGGELSVGENSLTSIELELDSLDKVIDEQKPLQSRVKLSGQRIHIKENASIKAHNGVVDVVASSTPDKSLSSGIGDVANRDDLAYIQMDRGASIDVQGIDASLAMARNFVTLELYSSELKDSPLQRNGILRGEEITVDIRKGTPLADIDAAVAAIAKSLAEHAAKGGTVNMISQGSIVLNEGAKINVSGGETTYEGGFVSSTKLLSNGQVIDISEADPSLIYDGILGVYTRSDRKNGVIYREGRPVARRFWESGYKAGNDAGAVNIAGYNMVLGADINSAALVGRYQSKPDTQPMGGKITIGLPREFGSFTDNLAPALVLSNASQEGQRAANIQFEQIESAFRDETLLRLREQNPVFTEAQITDAFKVEWAKLATQTELSRRFANAGGENNLAYLNVDKWVSAGAQNIDINSNGTIELAAYDSALILGRNTALSLNAERLVLNRSIVGAGAKLAFKSHADIAESVRLNDAMRAEGISLADGITFDVSGEYLNDFEKITLPENRFIVRDGGSIALKVDGGETLSFGAGNSLLADGGAYVSRKGKVADGKGGAITLDASAMDARYVLSARPIDGDNNVSASDGLVLSARALRDNGILTLAAEGFVISDRPAIKASESGQQTSIASADANGISSRSDLGVKGNQLNLTSAFFEDGAFSDYRLKASRGDVIIDAGTDIALVQRNLVLTDASSHIESAAALRDVATVGTLDSRLRRSVDLAISQKTDFDADLVIGSDASIRTEAGGALSFSNGSKQGGARILVDGHLQADAGQISFKLTREEATAAVKDRSMVWLGENAELLSRGVLDADFNDAAEGTPLSELVTGEVLDGGRIDIVSNGYLVIQKGALVDVSGTGATLDIFVGPRRNADSPYESRWVSSAAGQVNLTSGEGMVLNGELRAASEAVGASVENSALRINSLFADRNVASLNSGTDPSTIDPARHIQVLANTPVDRTEGLIKTAQGSTHFSAQGQAIELGALAASNRGLTVLNATTLSENFDNITIQTDGVLSFGNVSGQGEHVELSPERSLTIESKYMKLNAPQQGLNTATLASHFVSLGSERGQAGIGINSSGVPQAGTGSLSIKGSDIDIDNSLTLDGIRSLDINAENDIRLREVGTLRTAGDLLLTAREVVASTASDILLQALDIVTGGSTQSGRIVINSNGKPVAPALAAQGKVSLNAAVIEQNGALLAPFGQITLDATHVQAINNTVVRGAEGALSLGNGSTTSVSLQNQQVPFGTTLNGLEWVYGRNNQKIFTDDKQGVLAASISLQGETVDVAAGAKIDISGGGDLLAYEYIPGLGGSKDYLDINSTGLAGSVERYAIFPALGNLSLPYDQKFSATAHSPDVGMTIKIGQGSSVPAGEYLLLPAQYALLPGAYLVEKVPGYRDVAAVNNFKLLDGTPIVSGQIGVVGLNTQSTRVEGFSVRAGSESRQFSEYRESGANQFFAERSALLDLSVAAARPVDAGLASIDANSVLRLDGSIVGEAGEGGRLSALDISADNLRIVNALGQGDGSAVELTAEQIARLDVGSLLLGGRRSTTKDGLNIDVLAKQVSVAAGVDVAGQEIILVGKQNVTVKEGAALTSTVPATQEQLSLTVNNGAAVAAVSQRFVSAVNRSGNGQGASIVVENNARVASANSVVLDATGSTTLAGSLSAPGAVHLGASRVELGRVDGSGLVLDASTLASLSGVDLLGIQASDQMLVADGLSLNADALRLTTPSLQGAMGASGLAGIHAKTLTLTGGAAAKTAVAGQGELALNVENVLLGGGQLTIDGLGLLNVSATQSLQFVGDGHTGIGADTVNITTPLVSTSDGVTTKMNASGNLAFTATDAAGSLTGGVGGKVDVDAAALYIGNTWRFDSGVIGLNARTGDVSIGSGAELDVSGRAYQAYETTLFSDAGYLSMAAEQGRVDVQTGAKLDLSAPAGGGDAGLLQLKATHGDVTMSGTLLSSAEQGKSGRLKIDAQRWAGGLDGLAKLLENSGAHGGVDVRLRGNEGQVLSAGQVLKADDIALAFDNAGVEIYGQLDASGKRGGNINLQANGDVTLGAGSRLLARGSENRGGNVLVSAHDGALSFAADSTVDVSGGEGGDVVFRADIDDTRGVNIGDGGFAGSITGARRARLEVQDTPYLDNGTFDQSDADALRARAQAIQAGAAAIRARLALDENVDIASSLAVVSQGAYNWSQEVNFDEWQSYTDEGALADGSVLAGTLTVKAIGNLSMLGSLSDGFNPDGLLTSKDSWSYRLVAGADLSTANALHTAVSQANFVVGKDTKIRTGNGSIDIASANDFSLTNRNSVVYSAGRNTGLVLDPNDALIYGISGEKVVAAEGGNVNITAGHNLQGHTTASGNGVRVQAWTDWLQDNGEVKAEYVTDETGAPYVDPDTGELLYITVHEDAGRFVNYAAFAQGIAAMGGGNLSLEAGQDIVRLDASLPTTMISNAETGVRTETGKGQLRVHAAGDIISSNFLLGQGEGLVTALGNIRAERTLIDGRAVAGYTALAGGDFRYSARKNVSLLSAFDLSSVNHVFADGVDSSEKYYFSMDHDTAFSAVSIAGNLEFKTDLGVSQRNLFDQKNSKLFSSGANGQDMLVPSDFTLAALSGRSSVDGLISFAQADSNLVLWASDALFLKGSVTLMDIPLAELPSLESPEFSKISNFNPRQGVQLSSISVLENEESNVLLAATDGSVSMPSVFCSALPVDVFAAKDIDRINMVATHYDETDVSRFTAGRDIKLVSGSERISVAGPGRLELMAGRNINLGSSIGIETVGATTNRQLQGHEGADVFVFAGVKASDLQYNSFIAPLLDNRNSMDSFAAEVQSYVASVTKENLSQRDASERFRSLTLQQQDEFFKRVKVSVEQGKTLLSALAYADAMADTISRSAALRPLLTNLLASETGLAALADSYRLHEGSNASNSEALAELASLSEKDQQAIVSYGLASLDETTRRNVVVSTFAGLNESDRKPLITHAFYNELKMSGRNANAGAPAGYDRGYQAADAFLATASYAGDKVLNTTADGDLSLLMSKIYSVDGGDINLLVPGGFVNAGVVTPPLGGVSKKASELGIVVQGAGDVRAYLHGDFLVNQSRVFTLQEGNINMWSSAGNIDAGRGAKSAVAAPAPTVTTSDQGNVIINTTGAVAGSGIRQIDTTGEDDAFETALAAALPARSVDLVAPIGEINAGDAGIGASGNINIAAARVIGADNIDIGGVAVGVPVADTAGFSGGFSGADGAAAAVNKASEDAAESSSDSPAADEALAWLEVTFAGFGDEQWGE